MVPGGTEGYCPEGKANLSLFNRDNCFVASERTRIGSGEDRV